MVAPAMAGDVTVYGAAQVELTSVSHQTESDGSFYAPIGITTDCSTTAAQNQTTANKCDGLEVADNARGRIGFKASEDLGNGWKGLAKYELKADTTAGAVTGGRESFVGLKGGNIQIEAGSLKSAYKYAGGVKYDVFVTTALEARGNGGMSGKVADGSPINPYNKKLGYLGHNGFMHDHIAVQGGSGPISARLTYGPAAGDGSMTFNVMYKQNAIEAFVAMVNSGDLLDDGGTNFTSYTGTKLGGSYTMGPHKIMLQYEMHDIDAPNQDPTTLYAAYNMKMGKNLFALQIGQFNADETGSNTNDTSYLALGVIHKFTKMTRIFGGFRSSNADNDTREDVVSVGLRKDF
jgi:predicted porin